MLTVARQVGYMPGGATPGAVTGMITLLRVLGGERSSAPAGGSSMKLESGMT